MHNATPAERTITQSVILKHLFNRRMFHAGLIAAGFVILQNLDLLTFPLFGIERSPLVVTHMHWGALLLTAMLLPDRLYLRTGVVTVFLGWLVRYGKTPDLTPQILLIVLLLHLVMYAWTVLCARWMGWPRPLQQRELRINDLFPYALIALILYPLGWAFLHVLLGMLGPHPWSEDPLVLTGYAYLTLAFGVLCVTMPALLLGTSREQRRHSPMRTADLLLLIGYICLLRFSLAWLSSTPDQIPETLLQLRFMFAIGLVICMISLPWRHAAILLGLTGLLLPTVADPVPSVSGDQFLHILHLAVEMGALQILLALSMLVRRDNQRIFQHLTDKSQRDALSGVPNVNALRRDFHKHPSPPAEIGCLGIERLDTLMAGLGLAAQESLTTAIHRHLSPEVRAYTLGMGRFALLLVGPQVNWQDHVLRKLERFDFDYAGTRIRIEPHLGVCPLPDRDLPTLDACLHAAYGAMLTAWQRGETVPVFASDPAPASPARQTLQTHALALSLVRQHQVELHVQCLRRLDGREADMGEVLCRLRTPDGRLMMPSEYMAELNASRSMVELDQEVVRRLLAWMREHPDNNGFSRLFVNLTGRSLVSTHFRDWLLEQLDNFPDAARRLGIELTEHTIEGDFPHTREMLDTLRQYGCLIALDDFGTGMQSFERLQRLDVDLIKIDGRFVRNIAHNRHDRALVSTMTTIAKAYGAQTVAEHVEDSAALHHLRRLGVDWGQGFHIARPTLLSSPRAH